jgi:LysR family transcriptional regulator for metE and metH
MPVITDLLIEMVAGGEGVTVLPNWVAAPYTTSHDVEIVHLGAKPLIRTWYCATRPGPRLPHIDAFVQELTRELEAPTRRDWQAVGRPQRIERAATR